MTNYSLRARMMILMLAPTLLIGLLLSTFFVVHRYNDLQNQIENTGVSIIEPLAISGEFTLNNESKNALRELVNILHRRNSAIVRSIAIYDSQNRLFVASNYQMAIAEMQLPAGSALPSELNIERRDDQLILRIPIMSEESFIDSPFEEKDTTHENTLGYVALEMDLKSVRLQQYREIFTSTIMMIVCIIIALLFAYRLMRDVTGPIRNMVNTVDRIRRGQLDSRAEGHMLGELDTLKNGINSMAMSLTAYHEEMQNNVDQTTCDLRETLEQMEIQNVELDLAKKRAQEAVRIKSEFLANMSHELRTPLNGVLGFTRLALKTDLTPTQRDYLFTIERSASNLLSIINDVLDFSKLEADKVSLESIPFPLRSTLDETVTLLAHSAHEKGLELTLSIHPDVPDNVIGDPLRLQQILTNLTGNAIKFTEHGHIDVVVQKRASGNNKVQIEMQIRDTGIGIPEQEQSRLFQAFRQADASISRRHGGTGLGLVITQKLVSKMGGDISFHSQVNRGSTFWFTLNLDLNPNAVLTDTALDKLTGKHLVYVEANPDVTQSTLRLLDTTPLSVTHVPSIELLPDAHIDILLVGIPIDPLATVDLANAEFMQGMSFSDHVILALPCHAQVYAEEFKNKGITGCLLKPMTSTRLFPLLLAACKQAVPPRQINHEKEKRTMSVMAVDDNPANLKLIGALLADKVSHVVLCNHAMQALEQAKISAFDLILMDIQMPDIDGIQACELIHQVPLNLNTPVVAVTAHALAGQKRKLMQAGMNDYLAKPIDENKLATLLARYGTQPVSLSHALPASSDILPLGGPDATFDPALALLQSAGKHDLARDMLTMLLAFLPEVKSLIEVQLSLQQTTGLKEMIHKLHGSCSYCGVPHMKKLCMTLETHLNKGLQFDEIEPELLELLDEIAHVTDAVHASLSDAFRR